MKNTQLILLVAIILSFVQPTKSLAQSESGSIFSLIIPALMARPVVILQGKMWQKSDDSIQRSWAEANEYCTNLNFLGYNDWQLPTKDELKSLVFCSNGKPTPLNDIQWCGSEGWTDTYNSPTISPIFTCQQAQYWTRTPSNEDNFPGIFYWQVGFYGGFAIPSGHAIGNQFYVRCIR
jgi:hypothetical protein